MAIVEGSLRFGRVASVGIMVATALLCQSVTAPLTVPLAAQDADPVALLNAYRGPVEIIAVAGTPDRATELGVSLFEGDSIRMPQGGFAMVLFRDGRLLRVGRSVRVESDGVSAAAASSFAALSRSARTARAQRALFESERRPEDGSPLVLRPNSITVEALPVQVEWVGPEEVERWSVEWSWEGGSGSTTAEGMTATLEGSEIPPGSLVTVTVTAEATDGAPNPVPGTGRFLMADDRQLQAIEGFRKELDEVDPASRAISLALLHEGFGMPIEALRHLDDPVVAAEYAEDRQYHALRARTLERLGRIDEARAAMARADALGGGR